ncbi:MAG: energy transducer TonB [Methylocystis sp.]
MLASQPRQYPSGGGRRSAEASVSFTLDRRGHVVSCNIKRSAGHPAFDDAALAMMKCRSGAAAAASDRRRRADIFEVPVQFRAGGK